MMIFDRLNFFRTFALFLVLFGLSFQSAGAVPHESFNDKQLFPDSLLKRSIDHALAREQQMHAAKGYARFSLKNRKTKINLEGAVFIRLEPTPAFRLEALDDLGNLRFLLVSDGKTIQWIDTTRGEKTTLPATEKNLRQLMPMVGTLSETLSLWMGRVLPLFSLYALENNPDISMVDSTDLESVAPSKKSKKNHRRLVWDKKIARVSQYLFYKTRSHKTEASVDWTYPSLMTDEKSPKDRPLFNLSPDSRRQFTVSLQNVKDKTSLQIDYVDIVYNPPLEDHLFEVSEK